MTISLSEQGKKHIPWIEITWETLKISIGHEIEHPMQEAHYINSIDILQVTKAGLLKFKSFSLNSDDKPEVELSLEVLKAWTYRVQARCNLHWTWENAFVI